MKKRFSCRTTFLLVLIASTAFSSHAQQHFTLTCNNVTNSTGFRYCNTACALIYSPSLGQDAILLAKSKQPSSRLVGVWSVKVNGLWVCDVNYQDAKAMNYGEQFDVQYFANPDPNYQFRDSVYQPGATQTIYTSYIDHVNLNGNPKADFQYIAYGNGTNIYPVTFKYDTVKGKWYFFNTNGKPLDLGAVYNIVINRFAKSDIIIDTVHPKIIPKVIDSIRGKGILPAVHN